MVYVWLWVRHGTLGWNSFNMHFCCCCCCFAGNRFQASHTYMAPMWTTNIFISSEILIYSGRTLFSLRPLRYTPFAYLCAICKTCKSFQWRCSETKRARATVFPFDIQASQAFTRSITPYWNRTSADIYYIYIIFSGDAREGSFRFANHGKNMSERTVAMHFLWSP